jgi:hypothetical protein
MTKLVVQLGLGIVLIGFAIALIVHQWNDCLGENSILTCMRMLN